MEILHLFTDPEPCPYLDPETATFEYRQIEQITREQYESLLTRGWRRFGTQFFRPVCHGCVKCKSLRLEVDKFKPNRSQRRTLLRNADVVVALIKPTCTAEHIDLYRRYHSDMSERKGWPRRMGTVYSYRSSFVQGAENFGFELQYRLNGQLVGVALTDLLSQSASSVYTYYDPEMRSRGLGLFSVLKQLELGRIHRIDHLYLGFWIEESPSMRYKAGFKPHEILNGRPDRLDLPIWVPQE